MEQKLYNGEVTLKFSPKAHRYYANGKVCQGVTSVLHELYPSDDLLEWYSSMASQDIVMSLAQPEDAEWIKNVLLAIYKGETDYRIPENIDYRPQITGKRLIELYQIGKDAPKKRSQYGKDVGTQVHEAIDKYHKLHGTLVEPIPGAFEAMCLTPTGNEEQDKAAIRSFTAYVEWFAQSGLEVIESERMLYSREYNYAGTTDRVYKRISDGALILGDSKTSNLSRKCPTGVRESYWSQEGAYMRAYREEFGVAFADAVIINLPKNGSLKVVYASDAGFNASDLESIWLDDIKAFRNHKFLRNAKLRSRVGE